MLDATLLVSAMALNAEHMILDPEHRAKALVVMRVMTGRTDQSLIKGQRERARYLNFNRHVYRMPGDGMIRDISCMTIRTCLHVVFDKIRKIRRVTQGTPPLSVVKMRVVEEISAA